MFLLHPPGVDTDIVPVSVIEGDSVTLYTDTETIQQEECEGPSKKAMRHENPISKKKRIILISPKIGLHLERKTNQILANNYASQRKGQQNQTKTIANQTDLTSK